MKKRVFSGVAPSGTIHIGNLLGAIGNWVENQARYDSILCVVDLHAITTPQNPEALRAKILEVANIYLAAGIEAVLDFMRPLLAPAAVNILIDRRDHDPKSMLQEWAQSRGFQAPTYRTIAAEGPDHAKVFEVEVVINGKVYGKGSGQSKQAATKTAARDALNLQGLF